MVTTISPAVFAGSRKRWLVAAVGFVIAAAVGGAVTGTLLAALGHWIGAPATSYGMYAIVGVAVLGALHEFRLITLPLIPIRRQVQRGLRARWPLWTVALAYGVQLGAGVMTRVTTTAPYALWVAVGVLGNVQLGLVTMATFGITRAAVTMMASAQGQTMEAAIERATAVASFQQAVYRSTAPMLTLFAVAFATWAWEGR
jgi:hypothetical protein